MLYEVITPNDTLIQCSQPVNYVLNGLDSCPLEYGGSFSTNGCPRFSDENYVFTKTLSEAIDNASQINTVQSIESITYYDGLGGKKQEISIAQSPSHNDIIKHFEYDNYGRVSKEFLPYVSYNNNAQYNSNALVETQNYYLTNYSDPYPVITSYSIHYTKLYEPSV